MVSCKTEWILLLTNFQCVNEIKSLHKFADRQLRATHRRVSLPFACLLPKTFHLGVALLPINHSTTKINMDFALMFSFSFFLSVHISRRQLCLFSPQFAQTHEHTDGWMNSRYQLYVVYCKLYGTFIRQKIADQNRNL